MQKTLIRTGLVVLACTAAGAVALGGVRASHAARPAGTTAQKKLTIGFVTHFVGNPFIKQVEQAAKDAGKDLGVNVKVQGTAGFDPCLRYPVIFYLHGFAQDERSFLGVVPSIDERIRCGQMPPTIVVSTLMSFISFAPTPR